MAILPVPVVVAQEAQPKTALTPQTEFVEMVVPVLHLPSSEEGTSSVAAVGLGLTMTYRVDTAEPVAVVEVPPRTPLRA